MDRFTRGFERYRSDGPCTACRAKLRSGGTASGWEFVGALVALGLGWSCTVGWQPEPRMTFELVGKHEALECQACHPDDQPIGPLPEDCTSCHLADRPPDHADGDCGICHTPFGWDDIVVNHDFFPLTGAHDLDCFDCHDPDTYEGLDPRCSSCHGADRPDDDHFPGQDCASCHTPTEWEDATFDHDDAFPLPHEGVDECSECHTTGDNSVFSCVDCHEHRRSEMDEEHEDEDDYRYESQACLRCHPEGEKD